MTGMTRAQMQALGNSAVPLPSGTQLAKRVLALEERVGAGGGGKASASTEALERRVADLEELVTADAPSGDLAELKALVNALKNQVAAQGKQIEKLGGTATRLRISKGDQDASDTD